MSKPLSPQAQAVMDATCKACPYISRIMAASVAAAALHAAADQVVPERPISLMSDYGAGVRNERQSIRIQFLAIAAELEAGGGGHVHNSTHS
jgi:hypothetical protein